MTNLYRRQASKTRGLAIGGVLALMGAASLKFQEGSVGVIPVAVGLAVIVFVFLRAARPIVVIEPSAVVLRFAGRQHIPFSNIARVDQNKAHDLELCLESGAKTTIPMSLLEDDDATWLRRELRKEMRVAASRRRR